jgi:hypothetical protein
MSNDDDELVMSDGPAAPQPAEPPPVVDDVPDVRLYACDPDAWQAHVKYDSERIYCYSKAPGQDYFHLILNGEIYLQRDDEKYCLQCALRQGVATQDRLFWQNRVGRKKSERLP